MVICIGLRKLRKGIFCKNIQNKIELTEASYMIQLVIENIDQMRNEIYGKIIITLIQQA